MNKLVRVLICFSVGVLALVAVLGVKSVVSDEAYAADKYVSAYFSNTESVPLYVHFVYLYGNCPNVPYDPSTIPGCNRIDDPGIMDSGYLPASNGSSYNFGSAYPVLAAGENPPYYVWWYATYMSGVQCVDPTDGIPPSENPLFYRVTINIECQFPDYVPPTNTPTPTPPLAPGSPTATPYCSNNDSKVDFAWSKVQSGWNYEVTWTVVSTGQSFNYSVGDTSGLTIGGFTPGIQIIWNVRAYLGNNIGPHASGNSFTTAPNNCTTTPSPTNTPPPGTLSCTPSSQSVAVNALASFTGLGGSGPSSFNWSSPGGNPLAGSGGASYGTRYSTTGTKTVTLTSGSQSRTCTVIVGTTPTNTPPPTNTPTPTQPPQPTPTINPPANYTLQSGCVSAMNRIRMGSFSSGFVVVYKLIDLTTGNIVNPQYVAVGNDSYNYYPLPNNRPYRAEFRNGGSTMPVNYNGPILYQANVTTGNCAPPPTNTPTPTQPPLPWDVNGSGQCYDVTGGIVRFNVSAQSGWYVIDSSSSSNPVAFNSSGGTYNNLAAGVYPFGSSGILSLYSGTYSSGTLRDTVSYTIPSAASCGIAPTATPTPVQSWNLSGNAQCYPAIPGSVGGIIVFNVTSSTNWYVINSFSPSSLPYTSGGPGTISNLVAGVYPFGSSGTLSLFSGTYPGGVVRDVRSFAIPSTTDCGNEPPCSYGLPDVPVFTGALAGFSGGHPPPMSRMPYVQWLGDLKGDPSAYYEFRITNDGDQNPETAQATSVDWNTQQNYWTTGALLGSDQDFDWNSSDYSKLSPHGAIGPLPAQSEGFPEDSILYIFVKAVNSCGHSDSLGAFCLKKDIYGWLKTTNGDVASGGLIDGGSQAPADQYNTTFLQLSKSGGISNFRSQNWSVSDDSKFSTNPASFSGMLTLYEPKAVPLPPSGAALTQGIYVTDGNLTYTGNYTFNGPVVVIVKNGSLYIENNLQISGNQNGVVFIVQGDINIRDTVTEADGIYIAQNTFRSAYNLPSISFTDQLEIDGAVYSYGGFALDRIIDPGSGSDGDVASEPGELINYEPKYLVIYDDLLAVSSTTWNEVAP